MNCGRCYGGDCVYWPSTWTTLRGLNMVHSAFHNDVMSFTVNSWRCSRILGVTSRRWCSYAGPKFIFSRCRLTMSLRRDFMMSDLYTSLTALARQHCKWPTCHESPASDKLSSEHWWDAQMKLSVGHQRRLSNQLTISILSNNSQSSHELIHSYLVI